MQASTVHPNHRPFPSGTSLLLSQKHSLMRLLMRSCFVKINIFPRKGLMKKSAISRSGEIHICPKENVKRNCKSVSQQQQTAIPKVNICLFSKFSGSPTTFSFKKLYKGLYFLTSKRKRSPEIEEI